MHIDNFPKMVATYSIAIMLENVASLTYTHKMCKSVLPHLRSHIFKVCQAYLLTYTFINNWLPQIVTAAFTNMGTWDLLVGLSFFQAGEFLGKNLSKK